MQLRTFASSSRGNCTLIRSGTTAVLVDAGISCRKIRQRLTTVDLTPENLSGILITHEHTDHISGLPVFLKHYPLPVYATPGTSLCWPGKSRRSATCSIRFRRAALSLWENWASPPFPPLTTRQTAWDTASLTSERPPSSPPIWGGLPVLYWMRFSAPIWR